MSRKPTKKPVRPSYGDDDDYPKVQKPGGGHRPKPDGGHKHNDDDGNNDDNTIIKFGKSGKKAHKSGKEFKAHHSGSETKSRKEKPSSHHISKGGKGGDRYKGKGPKTHASKDRKRLFKGPRNVFVTQTEELI